MKKFKSKKIKKKKRYIKYIFIFFFFFSYVFIYKYISSNKLKNNILNKNESYINFDIKEYIKKNASNMVNNPINFMNVDSKNADLKLDCNNQITEQKVTNTLNVKQEKMDPIIYIYNTHQTEEYNNYSVFDAASALTNKLNDVGLTSIFEESSIKVFLENNNYKYYKSYIASRNYMNAAINNNPSLKYFFDIHRDSVGKSISTTNINGKNYAKVLLVVGTDNPGNVNNLKNANRLNDIIKSKAPGISRGVASHGGKGYNGVYNQDLSENVFLIEVGGKDNTKEEVENTINVIYESIVQYVRGII